MLRVETSVAFRSSDQGFVKKMIIDYLLLTLLFGNEGRFASGAGLLLAVEGVGGGDSPLVHLTRLAIHLVTWLLLCHLRLNFVTHCFQGLLMIFFTTLVSLSLSYRNKAVI